MKSKIPFLNEQELNVLEILKKESPTKLYVQEEQFYKDIEDLEHLQELGLIKIKKFIEEVEQPISRTKTGITIKVGFEIKRTKMWEDEI